MLRKIGLFSLRAFANASSPHGYQSTGLCWCCRRYGDFSFARRFVCFSLVTFEVELDTDGLAVVLFVSRLAESSLHEPASNAIPAIITDDNAAILRMNGTAQHTANALFRNAFCPSNRPLPPILASSPFARLLYAGRMLSAKPWKPSNALLVCAVACMAFGFVGIIGAIAQKMSGQAELDRG